MNIQVELYSVPNLKEAELTEQTNTFSLYVCMKNDSLSYDDRLSLLHPSACIPKLRRGKACSPKSQRGPPESLMLTGGQQSARKTNAACYL